MSSIKKAILCPKRTARFLGVTLIQRLHCLFSDRFCVKVLYRLHFGKRLDLNNPKSFNEKLNWLKVYYHNPLCTKLADKYEVKEYVRSLIGDEHIVKNYGVWDSFDEIDFDSLPDQFVIKATHDSGGVIICRDKKSFDWRSAKKKIDKVFKRNFYYISWEWPDKNIKPRVIIDEFLDDGRKGELQDYKFWCFNGEPKYMYITNKGSEIYENFYDMNFTPVDINHGFPRYKPEYPKPQCFDEMKEYASKLSKDIPFVRVDFFVVKNHVFFGEFTFFDWGGEQPFANKNTDIELGHYIELPIRQDI